MNTQDEILMLKKCVLSQFKTVLQDELKTIQDVYQYVQTLQFQDGLILRTDSKIEQQKNLLGKNFDIMNSNSNSTVHEKKVIPMSYGLNQYQDTQQINTENKINMKIYQRVIPQRQNQIVDDQKEKEIPNLDKDIFFKKPSTRNLEIKTKDIKDQEYYYKQIDEIQKVNIQEQRGDIFNVLNNYSKRIQFFDRETLLLEIRDNVMIICKNTNTLNAVYSKSFEILTGDKELNTQQINNIQNGLHAQQDLIELQYAQRNATLKGYSIYVKKDKDVAKQRMDEITQINDKKKLYL